MANNKLNAFLFVIDSSTMSRTDALDIIDKIQEVENWEVVLPDAAILISALDTKALNTRLQENFKDQRYIVTLLEPGKKNGWLPRTSWNFMNEPKSVHTK